MSAVYTKNELRSLIKINVEDHKRQLESGLTTDDGKLLTGALTFKDTTVDETMTPWDSVFSLGEDVILDEEMVAKILVSGHTRIPITREGDENQVVGILYAKDLVGIGFERRMPLRRVLEAFDAHKRARPPSVVVDPTASESGRRRRRVDCRENDRRPGASSLRAGAAASPRAASPDIAASRRLVSTE